MAKKFTLYVHKEFPFVTNVHLTDMGFQEYGRLVSTTWPAEFNGLHIGLVQALIANWELAERITDGDHDLYVFQNEDDGDAVDDKHFSLVGQATFTWRDYADYVSEYPDHLNIQVAVYQIPWVSRVYWHTVPSWGQWILKRTHEWFDGVFGVEKTEGGVRFTHPCFGLGGKFITNDKLDEVIHLPLERAPLKTRLRLAYA